MAGVSKVYPPQKTVLKNIYLSFFYGAKIGVIGLNGSGKSSLLKIIAGIDKTNIGEVVFSPGYTVGYLSQEPELDPEKTVREVVEEGVAATTALLKEYEDINEKFGLEEYYSDADKMDKLMARQGELQDQIDAVNAWELDTKLERAMDALRCPEPDTKISVLSGGERRRLRLAQGCAVVRAHPGGEGDVGVGVVKGRGPAVGLLGRRCGRGVVERANEVTGMIDDGGGGGGRGGGGRG